MRGWATSDCARCVLGEGASGRASGRRGQQAAVQYAERYSVPFLEPAADAAAEGVNLNWWEPTAAPTRVLLNPEGSPPPMFSSV